MILTQHEAEKLAREINAAGIGLLNSYAFDIKKLCDHILSGDHKREIENAAYERAAYIALNTFKAAHTYASENADKYTAQDEAAVAISKRIRALIQPPAQPGDKP